MINIFSNHRPAWKPLHFNTSFSTREKTVTLRNGETAYLRKVRKSDGHWLRDIYAGMSPESLYMRFNTHMTAFTPDFLNRLSEQTALDSSENGFGLLVFVEDLTARSGRRAIGVARYVKTGVHDAEIAFSIVDDYQKLGLGSLLVRRLVKRARAQKIRTLHAYTNQKNFAMQALLSKSGECQWIETEGAMFWHQLNLARPAFMSLAV